MSERYPDDTTLLALETDAATGVEYIPTGKNPYYLEFRKLIQRLLLAGERANDLRVYQADDLAIGVRPGRCRIGSASIAFAGDEPIALENNKTLSIWLDSAGEVQVADTGLPSDRTTFVPLAEVVTASGAIASITDLRGEAFLGVADLAELGLSATPAEIDQALDGVSANVTAAALNLLLAGPSSSADFAHRHEQMVTDLDAETGYVLANENAGTDANVALRFDLSAKLPAATSLLPDLTTGWLTQRIGSTRYPLVGVQSVLFTHAGELTASVTNGLVGVAPCDGEIESVFVTVGQNIVSDQSTDGLSIDIKASGTSVASTHPSITDAAGSGTRSTAQGDGAAGVIKTDGSQQVQQGDLLTVDLVRTAAGTISTELADVVVVVVIRPDGPA